MAAMMDRMIANDEAHQRRMEQEAVRELSDAFGGRFADAFQNVVQERTDRTSVRRATVLAKLKEALWSKLLSEGGTGKVSVSMVIDYGDADHFREHGMELLKRELRIAPEDVERMTLAVSVRHDNGIGGSGWTMLEVTATLAETVLGV